MTRLMITEETQRLAMQWLMEHGGEAVYKAVIGAIPDKTTVLLQNIGYLSYVRNYETGETVFTMTPECLKQLKDIDAGN